MTSYRTGSLSGVLAMLLAAASHTLGASITWTFQQIDDSPSVPGGGLAMSIGEGSNFPKVFYEGSDSGGLEGQLVGARLKPTGWKRSSLGFLTPPQCASYVRSRPGQDGRVGAVWQNGTTVHFAQYAGQGWQSSTPTTSSLRTIGAPDLAYMSGNRPVVAYSDMASASFRIRVAAYDGGQWDIDAPDTGDGLGINGRRVSMAVNSQDRIGVAYWGDTTEINFAYEDPVAGTWNAVNVTSASLGLPYLSLAFGSNDLPGLAYLGISSHTLDYAWFDPVSGGWESETIATGVESESVDLVFSRQGHPGMAYVGADGAVHYRVNDGGGWADVILPLVDPVSGMNMAPVSDSVAAVAFDNNDLPVISYFSVEAGLVMAYDPVTTPEPPSTLLLIAAWGALARRRRQRL